MNTRERMIHELLGKTVHVEVDRPIGYRHGDIVYPINYGYLPGVIAGDGEEQDAYILGVSKPISSFAGRVIGVIRRRNDQEDKLVVAAEGMYFHQVEIAKRFISRSSFSTAALIPCCKSPAASSPSAGMGTRKNSLFCSRPTTSGVFRKVTWRPGKRKLRLLCGNYWRKPD